MTLLQLSKLQLFCGYSFAAISIVALFISSLRRVGVHLTPALHTVPACRNPGGRRVLGVICSFVLLCGGIAFGVSNASKNPTRAFLNRVLECRHLPVPKDIGVADFTVRKKFLGQSDSNTFPVQGIPGPHEISVGNTVLRKPLYQRRPSFCIGTITPNAHFLCRRQSVVLNGEHHAGGAETKLGNSKICAQLPTSHTLRVSGNKNADADANCRNNRSDSREQVFVVHEPLLYSAVGVVAFFLLAVFGICRGYDLDYWGIDRFDRQWGLTYMVAAVIARIISFFLYLFGIGCAICFVISIAAFLTVDVCK